MVFVRADFREYFSESNLCTVSNFTTLCSIKQSTRTQIFTIVSRIAHNAILSTTLFISSALITSCFTQARFALLLWGGTFGGISLFLISSSVLKILGFENSSAEWIPSAILSLSLFNIQTLIHECGHALAGRLLLQSPKITIKIIPFFGGSTNFMPMIASKIGQMLQAQKTFLIIASCGPLMALSFSFSLLYWGIKNIEKHPTTGRPAICAATIDILFHSHSAISALWMSPTALQYDFVAIWTLAKIHPLICAFAIALSSTLLGYIALFQKKVHLASH